MVQLLALAFAVGFKYWSVSKCCCAKRAPQCDITTNFCHTTQGNDTHPGICESRCKQHCKSSCCANTPQCTYQSTWKDNKRSYWVCTEGCKGPSIISAVAKNTGQSSGLNMGDTLTIKFDLDTNEPSVRTRCAVQRVEVTSIGSFRLQSSYAGMLTNTTTLDSTDSSAVVKSAIEALPNIGYVDVVGSVSGSGLTSWTISFIGNSGQVGLLGWVPSPANSLAALSIATVTNGNTIPAVQAITSRSDPGWFIYGSFKVSYEGEQTMSLNHDASAEKMKEELEALSTVGLVDVTRKDADKKGGLTWGITFLTSLDKSGKVAALNVSQVSFYAPYTGPGDQVAAEHITRASGRRSIHELISFSSPVAALFDARWVSPRELEIVVEEPIETESANVDVGVLTLGVLPDSGLKRADGAKDAANATVVLGGTWGV